MKVCMGALALATLALASNFTFAAANTVVVPRPAARRAAVPAAAVAASPQHRYFGTLVALKGQVLTIALRNGRLLQVDATQAFALNRVAQPFFRGKPTVVDGTFGANGIFNATAVKRGAPLVANWGLDR